MKVEMINISRDGGKTWGEEEIDITNVDVSTCPLKPGEIILRNGYLYEIRHIAQAKRIETLVRRYRG
ncbi:hypothetical protein P4K96_29085 [Bacillus cereus]|uniref:hypothetical protein n=1 Tax=Paenibacillus melissococcoides TaxID=2912268 RepID=UPI002DC23480|nr:hypothetical protein [Bacillus cereus]